MRTETAPRITGKPAGSVFFLWWFWGFGLVGFTGSPWCFFPTGCWITEAAKLMVFSCVFGVLAWWFSPGALGGFPRQDLILPKLLG